MSNECRQSAVCVWVFVNVFGAQSTCMTWMESVVGAAGATTFSVNLSCESRTQWCVNDERLSDDIIVDESP